MQPLYLKLIRPFVALRIALRKACASATQPSFRAMLTDPLIQDTLKVSGMQVAPMEIEDTLLAHPDRLITDVAVAGVSGGRTSDERIPRAWVVLSPAGVALGEKEVISLLNAWVQERLSRYKWLRGGIGIVKAVGVFYYFFCPRLVC